MINKKLKLSEKIFTDNIEQKPTRDGYGNGLVELGGQNPNVVVLCADLAESTRSLWFKENTRKDTLRWAWRSKIWRRLRPVWRFRGKFLLFLLTRFFSGPELGTNKNYCGLQQR